MPIEIVVPRTGWSMEEGTFAGWMKSEGERVQPGDRLFALESDKAVEEAESIDGGILHIPPDAPKNGDRVKVGQVLGYLLAEGETPAAVAAPAAEIRAPQAPQELGVDIGGDAPRNARPPSAGAPEASPSNAMPAPPAALPAPEPAPPARETPVTPRARRAAKETGVDVHIVNGTGREGRIRERDVLAAAASATAAQVKRPGAPTIPPGAREIPITAMRRTIAERMRRSLSETAPVTLNTRADATNFVALRQQFKVTATDASAPVPAFTDILAKLCAIALQQHPLLGGRWEKDRILLPTGMHIGIAVDTEAGLLVPVVRDVQDLALPELARRSRALIAAAQSRQIRSEDLSGSIFTITNLGSFGIDAFTPIINFPETAILGVGAVRREVVVQPDGHFGSREMITLSLTFDHRVVDGAPAARFLQLVCQGLENPAAWLLNNSSKS